MKLDRRGARREIGRIVGKLVFPHGRPEPEEARKRVTDVANRAKEAGSEDVLPKHVNQLLSGSGELVQHSVLIRILRVLDHEEKVTREVLEFHDMARTVTRTHTSHHVRRDHPARRAASRAMMYR